MKTYQIKQILIALSVSLLWSASGSVFAWGQDGHRVIGALALDRLNRESRHNLYALLGTSRLEEITQWCTWPDSYRSTDEGAWTAPLHFINIPPGTAGYDKTRDCGDDLCVTEAISRFALELGNLALPEQTRREAFGFVCHFVGDLSQPLHAGFEFDRGGNDFQIVFNGVQQNLHRFWDSLLIDFYSYDWRPLRKILRTQFQMAPAKSWQPGDQERWTDESHRLAEESAYPDGPVISQQFADHSWQLVRQQLVVGGRNLATVLNSVLSGPPQE